MTPISPAHRDPAPVVPAVPAAARVTMALAAALLVGVLTSFGQAVQAFAVAANSAAPWFGVAVLLCLLARVRTGRVALPLAMLLGVVLLELMHVGYWAATNLRGYPDVLSPTGFWVVVGVPAGLLAGGVAVALRVGGPVVRAGALGVVAAVFVGEGVRALHSVATAETLPGWIAQVVIGMVVLGVAVWTAPSTTARTVALVTGVVGAAGVLAAYLLLGG
ncbi:MULTISPECIES: DUF6518 family protein [unclassified Curtobacterium]|uniref:DUF6518 family protein n=1 Tax=unclassified Curtobacterium TaxID=257496 RepID=UPI0008260D3E|nr:MULTISPECIES: DUF6518 family protein [unclassified Curtobacterium]WIA97462.1 DUF6518 family protein [Curtobacterium sp. MCBA15_004]WIB00783.1 DUF6518 family protein [Curtobacterium sp. MCBA15_012]